MSKFENIKNAVTSKVGRQVLQAHKHSPHVMFGVGVVGVVATVVLASRATLRLEEVVEETQDKMEQAKQLRESENPAYSEHDYQLDTTRLYVRQSFQVAKLYAPAFLIGATSIGLLTGSHVQLTKRNAGVMAAYAALQKATDEYRARVVADVGADKEREYRFGAEEHELFSETKEGEPIVERVKRAAGGSTYSRLFDEHNSNWQNTPDFSYTFLSCQQKYFNEKLNARGHVFLNEVYDALDMPRSSAGAVVGWVKDNPKGDSYVDFGIMDEKNVDQFLDFMQGREKALWLDFNVDGVIYNLI